MSSSSTTIFNPPSSPVILSQAHHYITLKLNSSNYLLWRTQLDPYLQGHNLFGYVTGEFARPPSFLPSSPSSTPSTASSTPSLPTNPAAQTWDAQDKLLMSLLISSLSEDVIPLAIGLTSSANIWSTLSAAFASPSNTCMLRLSMEQHSPQKHDETLTAYLHRIKRISDELSASARPISQSDFLVAVLKGLRAEFTSLKSSLSMLDTPLSFSALLSKCLSHEFITEPNILVDSPSAPTANNVQRFTNNAPRFNHHRGQSRGTRGHGRGNFRPPIPQYSSRFHRPCCVFCGGSNHDSYRCYFRPQSSTSDGLLGPTPVTPSPAANFIAPTPVNSSDMSSPSLSSIQWYPDTGANYHVTQT